MTGIDISDGMLDHGREKINKLGLNNAIKLLNGDSETINFPDNSFDAVMVAFGVRNFQHLEQGLSEIRRVLRPGGRLVVLEFSKTQNFPLVKPVYNLYMKFNAEYGKLFSRNRDAYLISRRIDPEIPGRESLYRHSWFNLGYRNTYSNH